MDQVDGVVSSSDGQVDINALSSERTIFACTCACFPSGLRHFRYESVVTPIFKPRIAHSNHAAHGLCCDICCFCLVFMTVNLIEVILDSK